MAPILRITKTVLLHTILSELILLTLDFMINSIKSLYLPLVPDTVPKCSTEVLKAEMVFKCIDFVLSIPATY